MSKGSEIEMVRFIRAIGIIIIVSLSIWILYWYHWDFWYVFKYERKIRLIYLIIRWWKLQSWDNPCLFSFAPFSFSYSIKEVLHWFFKILRGSAKNRRDILYIYIYPQYREQCQPPGLRYADNLSIGENWILHGKVVFPQIIGTGVPGKLFFETFETFWHIVRREPRF